MHPFWLVLTHDLLEDRCIDDYGARFKFDSCMILSTNHKSLLSIATNQCSSFCIDNRLRQSSIFVSFKEAKFEIKRFFFPYSISILYYIKQIHSMLPCVCSVIGHRGRQNVVRTSVAQSVAPRVPLFWSGTRPPERFATFPTNFVIQRFRDKRQKPSHSLAATLTLSAPFCTNSCTLGCSLFQPSCFFVCTFRPSKTRSFPVRSH